MKTNKITAALLLAGLFSCTPKIEFNDVPFAAFDQVSVACDEAAGTIEIPVTAYSFTSSFTLTFSVENGTAIAGEDFEILDNNTQVLRFSPEAPTQIIKVSITEHKNEFTGNKAFAVKLANATEGVTVAGNSVCSVVISDLDHPLSSMLGDYTATGTDIFGYASSAQVTITPDPEDTYKVWIDPIVPFLVMNGISGFNLEVYGIVSEDMKTIEIPYFQNTSSDWSDLNGGPSENFLQLVGYQIVGNDVEIVDSGLTSLKLEWSDAAGGYLNDSGYTLAGSATGKIGNYRYMYFEPKSLLFKKK